MTFSRRWTDESGVALITALLAVMLMSAMMVGLFAALATDQRSHALDRDQTQAYAAAQAGLEKITSSLASLFITDYSPSAAEITAITSTPPVLTGFTYTAPGGTAGSGYAVSYPTDSHGNPLASNEAITTGPFTGFQGLITDYTATITAVSSGGAEVRLRRSIQTVAIPIFQFGIFSDSDLSIFAGDNFSFGGRVHTNGSLFVCEQSGSNTMTFTDRITVVNAVVRNYFSNGLNNATSTPGCTANVLVPTSSSTNRDLQQSPNEGSITGMPPVPWTAAAAALVAVPTWPALSTGTYKSYITTALTGAKILNLPLTSEGAMPVDLIRRPCIDLTAAPCAPSIVVPAGYTLNENTTAPLIFNQRYYSQASLRILLSDRASDITSLPTVTATAPVPLDGTATAAQYNVGAAAGAGIVPPIAKSIGPLSAPFTKSSSCCTSTTIKMAAAISGEYALPSVAGNLTIGGVNASCTIKTATTFAGCTIASSPASGSVVSAILPTGITVTGVTTGAISGASPSKIVTPAAPPTAGASGIAGFTTAPFTREHILHRRQHIHLHRL